MKTQQAIKAAMDQRNVGMITMPVVRILAEQAAWENVYKASRTDWESITPIPYKYGAVIARKGNYKKAFKNNKECAEFFAQIISAE